MGSTVLKIKHKPISALLLIGSSILVLLLSGCQPAGGEPPSAIDTQALYTQAAQTIVAELTATAIFAPPTNTFAPTATLPPAASATPSLPPATATPTPSPTPTSTPTLLADFPILYQEDFADERGWHTDASDDFGFEFADGGYRIYVNLRYAGIWSIRSQTYGDVRLEVDGARTGGPSSGYYGVVCRHQDEDNYYALVVSDDGVYGIARMLDGELDFLEEGQADPAVIHPDGEVNRVRGDCLGGTFSLYANGQKLLEVDDDTFDEGDVGLIAGTRQEEDLEVLFDNFVIYGP